MNGGCFIPTYGRHTMTDNQSPVLRAACVTDVGRSRNLNEDYFCIDEAARLLLVADGMGGHMAGEVASRVVVEQMQAYLAQHQRVAQEDATDRVACWENDADRTLEDLPYHDTDQTLEDLPHPAVAIISSALEYANTRIYQMNEERGFSEGQGMGTTVAGLWLMPNHDEAVIFHVGDSRLYLHREGRLVLLTRDHTLYQQWEGHGRIGPAPPQNIILRCLGSSSEVIPEIRLQTLREGDMILICSDGLTSMLSDFQIETTLNHSGSPCLQNRCQELVTQANNRGGHDNITVLLARYG
jgi:serine/threonine protein phosphatase PrpC